MKKGSMAASPAQRRLASHTRVCAHCGEEFEATQEHASFKRKYCSFRCTGDAHHERVIASYPPREEVVRLYEEEGLSDRELGSRFGHSYQWAFKVRQHYGIAGAAPKRKPLEKSGDRARWGIGLKREPCCRNCKRTDQVLHLHHAIPRSMCRAAKYDLRNGVPLCTRCHLGWHRRSVVLYRDIFTADEWAYISTVELTGQRIEAWLEDRYPNERLR